MVTERGDPVDRLRGFARGCDDYVVRPFVYEELVARMRAVLRRTGPAAGATGSTSARSRSTGVTRRVTVAGTRIPALVQGVRRSSLALAERAGARLHEGGAAPRRLGVPPPGPDADARLAREPATAEAERPCDEETYVINVWGVGYRLVEPR